MRIKSHAPWMYAGMTLAGVITLGFMGTYQYLMRQAGRDGWLFYAFVTPFVLVGVFLTLFGGRFLVRLARLGSWQLDLPDGGGVFGHPLEVTLLPSRQRVPSSELTCHLRCIRISRSTRANSRADTTTVWETTWTTRAGTIHPRMGLALSLPLPDSGQPTNIDRRTGSGVQWQLNVVIASQYGSEEPVFDLPIRA